MFSKYPNLPATFQLGLALRSYDGGQQHIGFVYKCSNDLMICHLCWHRDIRNELFSNASYLISEVLLDPINLTYLAAAVEAIAVNNVRSIPYGLRYPISKIYSNNKYIGNINGEGLTCASFVMSVFENNAFYILDKNTWQTTAADTEWQKSVVDTLVSRNDITNTSEIRAMSDMIGKVARYRPEQVFACGVVEKIKWPINYPDAEVMAKNVLDHLNKVVQ